MLGMGAENPTVDSVCIQVHTEFLETISFHFQAYSKPVNTSVLQHIQPPGGHWSSASLAVRWEEQQGQVCLEGDQSEQPAKQAENCFSKEICWSVSGRKQSLWLCSCLCRWQPVLTWQRDVLVFLLCWNSECASMNMQQSLISPCPSQLLRRSS